MSTTPILADIGAEADMLMTASEILVPLAMFAIIVILRSRMPSVAHEPNFHIARPLPSAGFLPMVQFFCDGGVEDDQNFVSQPGSFIDITLTIFDGITQLVDGSWPPMPPTPPPTRRKRSPDPLRAFLDSMRNKPHDIWEPPDGDRSSESRPWQVQHLSNLYRAGGQALMQNPREAWEIIAQVERLRKKREDLQSRQSSAMYGASTLNMGNTTDRNRTLPEVCADFGLDVFLNQSEKMSEWWGRMEKLWLGLEIYVCQDPRDSGSEPPDPFGFLDVDKLKFASVGNLGDIDIEQMLLDTLASGPAIYYSPKGTEVDLIIDGMIGYLETINAITEFSQSWMDISTAIRGFIQNYPIFENVTLPDDFPDVAPTAEQIKDVMLSLLDAIDYLSCYWLSLIDAPINFREAFVGFDSEDELIENFKSGQSNYTVLASLVFDVDENGTLPSHVTYKIRQNATITQTTKLVRDLRWLPGSDFRAEYYMFNGFVMMQDLIERSIIDLVVNEPVTEPGLYIQEVPTPCYIQDDIQIVVIEHMFPLVLVLSWVFVVSLLVRAIVYEKENRLKEMMKMMGLEDCILWLSWLITALLQSAITVSLLAIIVKAGGILPYTDGFLLWLILMVYALNAILYSFLISVFYDKAKIASACAGILYLLTYVPYMIISIVENGGFDQPVWLKCLCSFFSTTGIGLTGKYYSFYETTGEGLNFGNFRTSMISEDEFNPFISMMMSITSTCIYIILIWYIDNVHPGAYGLPEPWYFPFTVTYWYGGPVGRPADRKEGWTSRLPDWMKDALVKLGCLSLKTMIKDYLKKTDRQIGDDTHFQDDPTDLPQTISIKKLTKVYDNGKLAVDELSLNLYEGQILSFLGHNGAGKTTTMSILTGMIPPSVGTAVIYGMDIRTDMKNIRKSLGMCPQHNILFDSMTVDEHLQFYARLKGSAPGSIDLEVEALLDQMGLRQKRYSTVDSLSGGMKRKLSIGIAFISGSRAVILDEPTAGVDPFSRREIWDLILGYKHGRTIMLSTHHMDEADILGDRIAVVSHGTLKCCGSSLFLKGTFGEGYHLVVAKRLSPFAGGLRPDVSEDGVPLSETSFHSPDPQQVLPVTELSKCSERRVTRLIETFVSSAYLKAETPLELHYIVPFEDMKSGKVNGLFDQLDKSLAKLHIASYGVSDTSLEEVFLKVTSYFKAAAGEGGLQVNGSAESPADKSSEDETRHPPGTQRSVSVQPTHLARSNSTMSSAATPVDLAEVESYTDSNGRVYTPDPIARTQLRSSDRNLGGRRRAISLGTGPARRASWDGATNPHALPGKDQEMEDMCIVNTSSEDSLTSGMQDMVTGFPLFARQYITCLRKRFIFTVRNWKALISQVALPVIFVVIAMVIGVIGGPSVEDEPALELSTAQYFNVTKAEGAHYVPFSDYGGYDWSYDAGPDRILDTFRLPSGICATCVLAQPNSTTENDTYYTETCDKVLYMDDEQLPVFTLDGYGAGEPPYYVKGEPALTDKEATYYPKCDCYSDNRGFDCTEEARDHEYPPGLRVITSDVMQNITGQDESLYLFHTTDEYRMSRYGATTFGHFRKGVPYWLSVLPGNLKNMHKAKVSKAWFNSHGWHSMPTFVNAVNNAILRANLPAGKGNPAAYGITVINHPMNGTTGFSAGSLIFGAELIIAIMIVAGFSFIPAGFILFLVQERASSAKHLQYVSGLNPTIYWMANLTWDMLLYLLPMGCCAAVLAIFRIPAFTSGNNYLATVLLLLIFGWTCTPMMYPASFMFKEASGAYVFLACFNIFIGVSLLFVTFLLDFLGGQADLANTSEALKNVFSLFPTFCLGRGLMDIVLTNTLNEVNELMGFDEIISPFDWSVTGRNMVYMTVVGFLCYGVTLLIEYKGFIKPSVLKPEDMPGVEKEDPDVARERKRVKRGGANEDMVRLEDLTKLYLTAKLGKMIAVNRLCLGIPRGECFGMLGVNGAGKTTTFKMLTGDHPPSGGDAYIAGKSVVNDLHGVRKEIGYCPQFDALFDELTARQHLNLYANLRGIPSDDIDRVVEWALSKLELVQYADRAAGTYSGGNKRKLSTAIALLGDPPVIFLDEPTAGMDPYAKRFLWDLILSLVQEGKCIILTSHSMEECETLCTRLAIMVGGKFRCLGGVQHLKSRFGDGYSVKITVKGPDYTQHMRTVVTYMNEHLPYANLKECHFNMLDYELEPRHAKLSEIFQKLEAARKRLPVEDYSVNQNTLDNVFINFVTEQQKKIAEDASRGTSVENSGTTKSNRSVSMSDLGFGDGTEPGRRAASTSEYDIDAADTDPLLPNYVSKTIDLDQLEALGTKISLDTLM